MRFQAQWVKGPTDLVPGIVTEMSLNGLLFATEAAPPGKAFDIIVDIGTRKVRLRLTVARSGQINRGGKPWTFFGCTYSGVAADDYDAIVRVLKDEPEPQNKAAQEIAAIDRTDDAYRLLPMRVQERVLDVLVRKGRLDMPQAHQQPLMRLTTLGQAGGKQRLAVHSRVATKEGMQSFDSVILIDQNGEVTIEH